MGQYRRLFRGGNSVLMAWPTYMLDALGVRCGMLVDLEVVRGDSDERAVAGVMVRALKRRTLSLFPAENARIIATERGGSD